MSKQQFKVGDRPMKYLKAIYFLAQLAAVFMAILVTGKLVCVLCAAKERRTRID